MLVCLIEGPFNARVGEMQQIVLLECHTTNNFMRGCFEIVPAILSVSKVLVKG